MCLGILESILIFNNNHETVNNNLRKIVEVLERLQKVRLAIHLQKSFFMQKEIDYLG